MVTNATEILRDMRNGDRQAANRLLPVVYAELRARAAAYFKNQRLDHTLQPTALVHEAYMKLVDQTAPQWSDRAHFCAVAATAMRQILIDHARSRESGRRGGHLQRVSVQDAAAPGSSLGELDAIALDEALTRLARMDDRQARVVELRFYGGLSVEETAAALNVSPRTVELDWKMAKAWLSRELSAG